MALPDLAWDQLVGSHEMAKQNSPGLQAWGTAPREIRPERATDMRVRCARKNQQHLAVISQQFPKLDRRSLRSLRQDSVFVRLLILKSDFGY